MKKLWPDSIKDANLPNQCYLQLSQQVPQDKAKFHHHCCWFCHYHNFKLLYHHRDHQKKILRQKTNSACLVLSQITVIFSWKLSSILTSFHHPHHFFLCLEVYKKKYCVINWIGIIIFLVHCKRRSTACLRTDPLS